MQFLKKTRSKLRGQSSKSSKGSSNNGGFGVTKAKAKIREPIRSNSNSNNDHRSNGSGNHINSNSHKHSDSTDFNKFSCSAIENNPDRDIDIDLYSSSGSTEQVTLFSDNTTDSSSTTGSLDVETSSASSASTPPKRSSSSNNSDAYADVRNRVEALSLHCRMVHIFHSQDSSSLEYNGEPTITFFAAWTTYLGYAVLIFVGHIREVCSKIFQKGRYNSSIQRGNDTHASNYAPLLKSFENFYTRRLYHRIQDCFNRPISSNPGAKIDVLERISYDGNKTMQVLGKLDNVNVDDASIYKKGEYYSIASGERVVRKCLNLGSYNYLGFGDDWSNTCKNDVLRSMDDLPCSMGSSRLEIGTSRVHDKLEKLVAEFIGKESAMVTNMGFNSNATTIPALMGHGDLIVSDELNHTSIVNGARTSGSAIRCFRHNDSKHLEEILKEAIVMGQPRTRRPWKKIMVIVEGIYSMEGEYSDLRNVVKVCKKYGVYVYVDEAHSVGAMGPTGRGICEYAGVDTSEVDIMMGTFSKSFGGMGGYIAGDKDVIDNLRRKSASNSYHNSLSPVVCQQIITSLEIIMGRDGTDLGNKKLTSLRDNSNYFRMRLVDMGLHVLGHYDSPIMPVMLYNPTKIAAFSRECLKRGLAVVVVGFPAVPILMSRARFCISASHTREDLDYALNEIDEIADLLKLRYARSRFG